MLLLILTQETKNRRRMKKLILIALIAITTTASAQTEFWIEKIGTNTWKIEGNTDIRCPNSYGGAVRIALLDKNKKVMKVVRSRLEFGHFSYAMNPLRSKIEYIKVECND